MMFIRRIDIDETKIRQVCVRKIVHVDPVVIYHEYLVRSHSAALFLMTTHGLPAAIELGGISCWTTLPAAIMVFSPIVTPLRMITPPPMKALSPIFTGAVRMSW